jgi:TDG/mug DNA glycosylase family protein
MRIVSIGLNPSIKSVEAGFYFANPRNRFWAALNAANLVPENLTPGADAQRRLLERYGIGFTDVVKRATRGSHELRAADFREWAPILERKLLTYKPRVAWFHGKLAYRNYLKCTGGGDVFAWGKQPLLIGESTVFVTPNPSPANAAFGMDTLVAYYRELAPYPRTK